MSARERNASALARTSRWLAAAALLAGAAATFGQGTRWTYQGRLDDGGSPADGTYDLQFKLFDAAAGGSQVGVAVDKGDTSVAGGLFAVVLDFGSVFDCGSLWLEIGVRPGVSVGAYTVLSPRQEITSAPHAIFACTAEDLVLPFDGSAAASVPAFKVTNTTTGKAGHFEIANAASGADALTGRTNGSGAALSALNTGSGRAASIETNSSTNSVAALYSKTAGTGWAGIFEITNSSNANDAVWGHTVGVGSAGFFDINNASSPGDALEAFTNGTGDAGVFTVANPASLAESVEAQNNGGGDAVYGNMSGTGRAGYFSITNSANHGVALEARTNAVSGTTIDGIAIKGWATSASGDETYGVWGESAAANGRGVYGKASSSAAGGAAFGGFFESASPLGSAVHAIQSASGASGATAYAVWGSCTSATSGAASAGVRGTNYGTDPIPPDEFPPVRYGVWGEARGYGYGVYGTSIVTAGIGVRGEALSTGVSGIASANTGITYGVYAESDSNAGFGGHFLATRNGGVAIYGRNTSNAGPIIEGWNTSDREFYVDSSGDVFCDGAFTGGGADFAERLPAAEPGTLEPGDVIVFDPRAAEMALSRRPNDPLVVGVYSTKPGFLGGAHDNADDQDAARPAEPPAADPREHLPVALVGIVPVKVSGEGGPIRVGDLLTSSSTPGHAMKAAPIGELGGRPVHEQGTILGKAMENWSGQTGRIKMLVLPR